MLGRNFTSHAFHVPGTNQTQRVFLAVIAGLWLALAWWVLLGPGLQIAAAHFSWIGDVGNPRRRAFLGIALSIYYVRLLFTWFVFLKRALPWSEAFTVAPWLLCIFLSFAVFGGASRSAFATGAAAGAALFVAGSWMNSYAEFMRNSWRERPENRGRLYTQGLFRYSRHPNYLGDLISFSGLCMISGQLWTWLIPGIMLAGFIFGNIPALDTHLREKYGNAFDAYAARTRKLIPFVY